MRPLVFEVPGIPVPCARARIVENVFADGSRNVKGFTPDRTAGYEQLVADRARIAANLARWSPPEGCAFELLVNVYRVARRGDWDNYGKAIADALTKAKVWSDDRYVEDARVRLFVDKLRPRVEVQVRVMGGGP